MSMDQVNFNIRIWLLLCFSLSSTNLWAPPVNDAPPEQCSASTITEAELDEDLTAVELSDREIAQRLVSRHELEIQQAQDKLTFIDNQIDRLEDDLKYVDQEVTDDLEAIKLDERSIAADTKVLEDTEEKLTIEKNKPTPNPDTIEDLKSDIRSLKSRIDDLEWDKSELDSMLPIKRRQAAADKTKKEKKIKEWKEFILEVNKQKDISTKELNAANKAITEINGKRRPRCQRPPKPVAKANSRSGAKIRSSALNVAKGCGYAIAAELSVQTTINFYQELYEQGVRNRSEGGTAANAAPNFCDAFGKALVKTKDQLTEAAKTVAANPVDALVTAPIKETVQTTGGIGTILANQACMSDLGSGSLFQEIGDINDPNGVLHKLVVGGDKACTELDRQALKNIERNLELWESRIRCMIGASSSDSDFADKLAGSDKTGLSAATIKLLMDYAQVRTKLKAGLNNPKCDCEEMGLRDYYGARDAMVEARNRGDSSAGTSIEARVVLACAEKFLPQATGTFCPNNPALGANSKEGCPSWQKWEPFESGIGRDISCRPALGFCVN